MSQYMTLVGAEEVGRAASSMAAAAERMAQAAGNMAYAFDQQQRFMDDWLIRLESALEAASVASQTQKGGDHG